MRDGLPAGRSTAGMRAPAAVRDALLERIRAVTARELSQTEIEIEQGTVQAEILHMVRFA